MPVDLDFRPENMFVVFPIPSVSLHLMQTRSKSGISKKKVFSATVQSSANAIEPTSYKSSSKFPKWQVAMQEEIDVLHAQKTWSLVPLPSRKNLVSCKWVYRIKRNHDGSIARHKARLVAKALAAQFNWSLRQLDVKNAFLHGDLNEEVYMAQPPGFHNSSHPSQYVCKLNKSLYGLKQTPSAWNEKFTSYLPGLGFKSSFVDPSLFVKHSAAGTVVLLFYVDDINFLVDNSSSQMITDTVVELTKEFDMKDLGQLH
ncbi:hypothetical protein ACFXTH_017609 [Malus domestica]